MHAPASALFISVREATVEFSLGCHYYCADGGEGWERQRGQIKSEIKRASEGRERRTRGRKNRSTIIL